jgi:hypothetical protein
MKIKFIECTWADDAIKSALEVFGRSKYNFNIALVSFNKNRFVTTVVFVLQHQFGQECKLECSYVNKHQRLLMAIERKSEPVGSSTWEPTKNISTISGSAGKLPKFRRWAAFAMKKIMIPINAESVEAVVGS